MTYYLDIEPVNEDSIIPDLLESIKKILDLDDLNENEYKLGLALTEIFENYENIFPASANNKFNKNIILLSLREITNMSTKEIRSSMKRYKKIYLGLISPEED
jgi:hypothetical protein